MKNLKWPLYLGFILVVALIYFGTNVISSDQKTLEKSRVMVKQTKSVQVLLRNAHKALTQEQRVSIDELNVMLERAETEPERIALLEQIAGRWFSFGQYAVSGHYAEEIAGMRDDAEAWAIAGTTYAQGLAAVSDEREKVYCAEKARAAFDQSKLLQPDNKDVDLNHALTYIQLPDESNPMAGIQMLLKLKDQYPNYAPVYRHLGRLGLQTGQYQKALERLRVAWSLEKDGQKVSCLLTEAFSALGQADSASYYNQYCKN